MAEPSALTAKLLEGMAKEAGRHAVSAIFGGLSKFRDALRMNFSDYLDAAIDRASHVKTLLHRDDRVSLLSIYVETFLKSGNKIVRGDQLTDVIRSARAVLVSGPAGAGKTMFIRYVFLQLIEGNLGVIPIFVELRGLNASKYEDDLISFMHELITRPGAMVTRDQFKDCLRENMFILVLDGLDEVEHDRRLTVERQIAHLRETYPKLGIVVTTRPDERLRAWSDFEVYHIQPMKKAQVKKLISKLPYDRELRTRFVKEVDKHLYNRHRSLLSNPLLATMMLMTFDQFAHIPDKIHIFYEQAFQTLFLRHDAGKQAGFRRKMYTDLAINDFKNCLSAVCVSSYFREKYSFSEAEILEYIRTAVQFEKLEIKEDDFLKDLLESTCVLQRDGLFITFTHRSFQEYFAAFFVTRSPSTSIGDLLDKLCMRALNDNVIPMAFDMNRPLIVREWILPRITDLTRQIKRADAKNGLARLAESMNLKLLAQGTTVAFLIIKPEFSFILTLGRLYNDRSLYVALNNEHFEILLKPTGDASLQEPDLEWLMQTTIPKSLWQLRDALLSLSAKIGASVSQEKKLVGSLFE
jgi:hypothetical protein